MHDPQTTPAPDDVETRGMRVSNTRDMRVSNTPGQTIEVSDGARVFYNELIQLAQAANSSSTQPSHSPVLPSVTAKKLSRDVRRAYSLVHVGGNNRQADLRHPAGELAKANLS